MFGVGLHFSLKDLMSVRAIAIPGAVVQIGVATMFGMGLGWALGWSVGGQLVFGLALSVASTVVLLRALQERRLVDSERGRIAVGWLIVEDIAMVLALVLLPPLADILKSGTSNGIGAIGLPLVITLAKVAAFVAFMLIVGRRVIPAVLHYVAHTGSRELFRLAVLAISLGVAFGASTLFDVSFALGAFFAGMILSESELSQRAANETLPLRDAFAVLFFVSVGMLFDPTIVLREPVPVIATVLIIVVVKSVAAFGIVRAFGHRNSTALTISASLAQIGEFSFILAGLGVSLALMPERGRDLILAGAILSILINPFLFTALDRVLARDATVPAPEGGAKDEPPREEVTATSLTDHIVLVGYGRVGTIVGTALKAAGQPLLVIENSTGPIERARAAGLEVISGHAVEPGLLEATNLGGAKGLLVAIPDGFEGGQIVTKARALAPRLRIVARAHSDEEVAHLKHHGANFVIMGEEEIAKAMLADVAAKENVVG
jgi:CPA2 family monovalent cation:H+ antiporter-2